MRALSYLWSSQEPLAPENVLLLAPLQSLPFQQFLESGQERAEALRDAILLVAENLADLGTQHECELASMLEAVYLEPQSAGVGARRKAALGHADEDTRRARHRQADQELARRLVDPAFAPEIERKFGVVAIPERLRDRAAVSHRMEVLEHEIAVAFGADPRVHKYDFRIKLRAQASGIRVYTHRQRWTGSETNRREPSITVHGLEQSYIGWAVEAHSDIYELLFFYLGRPLEMNEEALLEWSETLTDDASSADPHLQIEVRYPRTKIIRLILDLGPHSLTGPVVSYVLDDIHVAGSTGRLSNAVVEPNADGKYVAESMGLTLGQCHRLVWPRLYPPRHKASQ